jgi:hypothetical protein
MLERGLHWNTKSTNQNEIFPKNYANFVWTRQNSHLKITGLKLISKKLNLKIKKT